MARACVLGNTVEFEGTEFGLRVRQDIFHRGKLEQIARIARAEAQTLAAIDHGAAQAESDSGNAVGKSHRRYGIEVVRTHHAGKVGIETRAVNRSHDLL